MRSTKVLAPQDIISIAGRKCCAQKAMDAMVHQETGLRGYLITGDEKLTRSFDPTAEETLFFPRLVGG